MLKIREAVVEDAAILWRAEAETAETSGQLVSMPEELELRTFEGKIAGAVAGVLASKIVQTALRHAADRVRTEVLRGLLPPASFRERLADIPPGERDGWLDLLWELNDIPVDDPELPQGCVPYLPCPVATVLEAVERAGVTCNDVFVDVGSGTGRTAFLANLLSGASCVGLEIQPALVEASRKCAARLNLGRMQFVEGDAADRLRFIDVGTVFFLYCPFDHQRVNRVLNDLQAIARTRQIQICCVQMPALERPWLLRVPSASVDLDIYRSTFEPGGRL